MRDPIFIHSSFRCCSTWFWTMFRANNKLRAYYEIFNEALADITLAAVNGARYDRWNSKHPATAAYFLEFASLIDPIGQGVIGYDVSMAYKLYIPETLNQLSDAEIQYIKGLINNAELYNKRPVLTATRSLGRAGAIKKEFHGYHIVLQRNIFHQWASYTQQSLTGNNYFLDITRRILNENLNDNTFKIIRETFVDDGRFSLSPNAFYAFAFLHLNLYARSADYADLIIDVDKLAVDRSYQKLIEEEIYTNTGIFVNLSTAKLNFSLSLVNLGSESLVRETLNAIPLCHPDDRTYKGSNLVNDLIEGIAQEYEKHRFYCKDLVDLTTTEGGFLDVKASIETVKKENNILKSSLVETESDKSSLQNQLIEYEKLLSIKNEELDRSLSVVTKYSSEMSNLNTKLHQINLLNDQSIRLLINERYQRLNLLIDGYKKLNKLNATYKRIADLEKNIFRKILNKIINFFTKKTLLICEQVNVPSNFDPDLYLKINLDILDSGLSPEMHYVLYGHREQREYSLSKLPSDFDPIGYLKLNPDLYDKFIFPSYHYVSAGILENRKYK